MGTFNVFNGRMLRKKKRNEVQNIKLKINPILFFLKVLKAPKSPIKQMKNGNRKFRKILDKENCISLNP